MKNLTLDECSLRRYEREAVLYSITLHDGLWSIDLRHFLCSPLGKVAWEHRSAKL